MIRGAAGAALAATAVVVTAAQAGAATLVPDRACYAGGDPVTLTGTAFTPRVVVAVTHAQASPSTDDRGAFVTTAKAPSAPRWVPRVVPFGAVDARGLTAWVSVLVVRERFGTNLPLAGRPRTRTWWRFAGFDPGQPIFGHFRTGGRTVRTYRFGVAHDACGVLSVRAPRLPVAHPRPGVWRLKLDQEATYRASSAGRAARFRVSPS